MSEVATFDENGHTVAPGWATYQKRYMRRFRLRCWMNRHVWPTYVPEPANGFSPGNYDKCQRCGAFMHWFVEGQHHWGGPPVIPRPSRRVGESA